MTLSARWGDLGPRILSALVLVALGLGTLWAGGPWFKGLVMISAGIMAWELARMIDPTGGKPVALGCLVFASLFAAEGFGLASATPVLGAWISVGILAIAALVGTALMGGGRWVWLLYSAAIMAAAIGVMLYRDIGLVAVLWLLCVVIASDVAGYFVGRRLGGPKFWPKISPKKTWSGTVAGWIAGAAVGAAFWAAGGAATLIWFSAVVAFAGQLGDIAESAIKRRQGVKDSSNLLPGHGGLMDRFDGIVGAAILVLIAGLSIDLPRAG